MNIIDFIKSGSDSETLCDSFYVYFNGLQVDALLQYGLLFFNIVLSEL